MKKFFITTILISLLASAHLYSKFNYSIKVLIYHLILIAILNLFVFGANLALGLIPRDRLRKILTNILNYLFLASLILFYITIIGSNTFWGKAITARLFVSYIASFDEFISILPVEKWIFYAAIFLLLLIISVLFWFIHPRTKKPGYPAGSMEKKTFLKRAGIGMAVLLLLLLIFQNKIMQAKRIMHFSGEPIMEFAFGQMWDSETIDYVYDKNRIQNGLKDKDCINSVTPERDKKSDRIVIVILLDALRKDFLPIYGYNRKTTPFLDSLSQAGKLLHVRNGFSNSTTTLLGVAGLFSSKDWDNFSYAGLNIMKYLKKKGFSTYAFLTGQHRSWYGLSSIYRNDCDFFYESTVSPMRQNFDDLTTLNKFRETKIKNGSFVYMHLLSTHNIGKKDSRFRKFLPDKMGLTTDKKTALINNYTNGILQADFIISGVFDKLRNDNQLENSTIFIVSDHGELFGEEGRWSHSGSVQQNVISIPFLIYDEDQAWYKNLEAASLKDVAPTIADRLGYTIPPCWEGISLQKPVQDFSIKINTGIKCEFPEGILSLKDSLYKLEIMDEHKNIRRVMITTGNGAEWKPVLKN